MVDAYLQSPRNQCGSELARDSVSTADINANCPTAFASKLAPTEIVHD